MKNIRLKVKWIKIYRKDYNSFLPLIVEDQFDEDCFDVRDIEAFNLDDDKN